MSGVELSSGINPGDAIPIGELPQYMGFRGIHIILLVGSFMGNMCAASITGCLPYILEDVRMEYSLTPAQAGLMMSGSSAGSIIGVFLSGWLADIVGRRPSLALSAVMTCLCAFPFLLLPEGRLYWANVALNGVLGIPFGALSTLITPYCLEFFPDTTRGYAAVLISLGWPAGSIWCIYTVGWQTSAEWRHCLAVGALVPGLVLCVLMVVMLESPRWLYTVGRHAEGDAVLKSIFAWSPLRGGQATAHAPKIAELQEESEESPLKLVAELFTKPMRFLTILACILYMLTASASFSGWTYAPAILARIAGRDIDNSFFVYTELAGVAGAFVGALTLDPLGRRPTLLLSYCLGLFAYAILLTPLATPATVGWIWLIVGLVQGLMWPALNTYLTEAFPTKLRGTGNGLAATFGRFANVAAPWVVGELLGISVYSSIALLMSFYALAAIGAMLIPQETSGVAMMDGLADMESKS